MSDGGEIWLRILIIILIVGVIIYTIINFIFYLRAFRGQVTGISSNFAMFMMIFSGVLFLVGIILGIWVLYYIFIKSGSRSEVIMEDLVVESGAPPPVVRQVKTTSPCVCSGQNARFTTLPG